LIAQVPPWSLFWWRCRDAVKAWWTALSGPPYPASKHWGNRIRLAARSSARGVPRPSERPAVV